MNGYGGIPGSHGVAGLGLGGWRAVQMSYRSDMEIKRCEFWRLLHPCYPQAKKRPCNARPSKFWWATRTPTTSEKRDQGKGARVVISFNRKPNHPKPNSKKARKIEADPERQPPHTHNPCRSQPAGDSANPNNKNPKAGPKTHSHQTAKQCPPTHHNSSGSCGFCGSRACPR